MLDRHEYPILEFDDNPIAKLNPSVYPGPRFDAEKLIITFFPEVIQKLLDRGELIEDRVIPGENPVPIYRFTSYPDVLLTLGRVGCPACAGDLDLFNAIGIRKVMFCGGGGVLDPGIEVGTILVVEGAIRDEGFSYHYLPPSRVVYARKDTNEKIVRYLQEQGIPHLQGLTWTTDAIFRETPDRIALRREEGAKIVEMEQAGCLAVARFRGFCYGALIYGGDDLSGEDWDGRSWRSREGVRYDLVQLCRKLLDVI